MNTQYEMYGITDECMVTNFESKIIAKSKGSHTYELTRKNSQIAWPNDDACLKFCDDRSLNGPPMHFGGTVQRIDNDRKRVVVYVD